MRDRLNLLDPLRLFAALSVVAFHYAYRGAAADGLTQVTVPAWKPVVQYGYLGVQLFFTISGLVIAMSAQGRTAEDFVIARLIRIYPGFATCMTISCVVIFWFGAPTFTTSATQWAANLLVQPSVLHQPFVDGVYWSIVYEIIFYGWIAVLLKSGLLFRHFEMIALCWIGLSTVNELAGPSLLVRRLLLTDASGFFVAGMMIHQLHAKGLSLQRGVILALAAELASGQAIIASRYNFAHFGAVLSQPLIVALSLAAIGLVGVCAGVKNRGLPQAVAVAVGGLTYPLYLLHQTIGFVIFNRLGGRMPPALLVTAAAMVMIALSLLVFFAVERPVQAWLKRRHHAFRPRRPAGRGSEAARP